MNQLHVDILPVLTDNYIFVLKDTPSNQVAVVDPAEAAPVIRYLKEKKQNLDQIFITHHHPDHTGGVLELKKAFGCKVTASIQDAKRIPSPDHLVKEGDIVFLGSTSFQIKELYGHTIGHIAYYTPEEKKLFSGDTFFAMGCGRLFEGTAAQMLANFQWLRSLPEETKIFCTHEYTLANGRFALTLEPENETLVARVREVENLRKKGIMTIPTTVKEELQTNPFARWDKPEIREHLNLVEDSAVDVFAEIRKRKDNF